MNIANRFQSVTIRVLVLLVLFSISLPVVGQEIFRFNFNEQGIIVPKEHAHFYRLAPINLSNFMVHGEVRDFYINDTLKMKGVYENGELEGAFAFFHPNGLVESRGSYTKGRRIGRWEYFHDNGQLKLVAYFAGDIGVSERFRVTESFTREGEPIIENGTGSLEIVDHIRSLTDETSLKRLTGQLRRGYKHGEFRLYRISDNKLLAAERFDMGNFVTARFPEDHRATGMRPFEFINKFPDKQIELLNTIAKFRLHENYFPATLSLVDPVAFFKAVTGREITISERPAGYRYGIAALMRFLTLNIRYPLEARLMGKTGRVFVSVQIDEQGNATGVSILRGANEHLDKEAVGVVRTLNNWLPAIREGVPVKSIVTIPVTFLLANQ